MREGQDFKEAETEGVLNQGINKGRKRTKFYILAAEDEIENLSLEEIRQALEDSQKIRKLPQ